MVRRVTLGERGKNVASLACDGFPFFSFSALTFGPVSDYLGLGENERNRWRVTNLNKSNSNCEMTCYY